MRVTRSRVPTGVRVVAGILLVAYIAVLAWLTLTALDHAAPIISLPEQVAIWLDRTLEIPFAAAFPVLEWSANVALFVPFGLLLPLSPLRVPGWFSVILATVASLGIEWVQGQLPDRVSSLADVAANVIGALIGVILAALIRHRWRPRERPTREVGVRERDLQRIG